MDIVCLAMGDWDPRNLLVRRDFLHPGQRNTDIGRHLQVQGFRAALGSAVGQRARAGRHLGHGSEWIGATGNWASTARNAVFSEGQGDRLEEKPSGRHPQQPPPASSVHARARPALGIESCTRPRPCATWPTSLSGLEKNWNGTPPGSHHQRPSAMDCPMPPRIPRALEVLRFTL